RGLVVHVRSALLQGLLLTDDREKWARAHVLDPGPVREFLKAKAAQHTDGDIARLCLAWVRSQPWVDGVVVGMDNLDQLHGNLETFSIPPKDMTDILSDPADFPRLEEETLNPALWSST
ncbi:MAG: aldo/keto reductase, partial [Pseudomonadota bacterium]